MKRYTFRGLDGDTRAVEAHTEADARHLAMCQRWGEPSGMYGSRYMGLGISLVSVEDN